jgi:hypothetical protein
LILQRRKWNSPGTVWGHFKKWNDARVKGPAVATETEASKAGNKDAKIAELQAKLDAYEKVGDVQLCKKDNAKDNAMILARVFSEDQLKAITKEILIDLDLSPEEIKALREEACVIARQKRTHDPSKRRSQGRRHEAPSLGPRLGTA